MFVNPSPFVALVKVLMSPLLAFSTVGSNKYREENFNVLGRVPTLNVQLTAQLQPSTWIQGNSASPSALQRDSIGDSMLPADSRHDR